VEKVALVLIKGLKNYPGGAAGTNWKIFWRNNQNRPELFMRIKDFFIVPA